MTSFATQVEGVRTVSGSTERDALFPSPAYGQKVYNETSGMIEKWNGSSWVQILSRGVFDVKSYGAVGDGATNDTAAIALALAAAQTAAAAGAPAGVQLVGSGAELYFPHGRYLTDEIKVTQNGIAIVGEGPGVTLLARAAGQVILRLSASYCHVQNLTLNANGFLQVRGLALVPANESQTTTTVFQNYNHLESLLAIRCVTGFEFRCGPTTGSGDSGCWYNTGIQLQALNCQRGFWFRDSSGGGNSPVNRCNFYGCRAGTGDDTGVAVPTGYGNVGFDLSAATTLGFYGCAAEGISLSGAAGGNPAAPNYGGFPVAIYIPQSAANLADNNDNRFYGFTAEGCTKDINCSNRFTGFLGVTVDSANKTLGTYPKGGYFFGDLSVSPSGVYPGGTFNDSIIVTGSVTATGRMGGDRVNQSETTVTGLLNAARTGAQTIGTRRPFRVTVYSNASPGQFRVYVLAGDGAGALNATSVTDTTGGTLVIDTLTATSFKVLNSTGSTVNLVIVIEAIGPALA